MSAKTQRGHRQTENRRLIDLSAILKAPFSIPCFFLAPDRMPRRNTDGEHFFTIFRCCIADGARMYSVVTTFGVLVDSTQGHKTTFLPLHGPFL